MEVSPIVYGCSRPHPFPVGRIVCRQNRNLAQPNTTPLHLFAPALPVYPTLDSPSLVDLDAPAWRRLIDHAFSPHELIPLVETMFTSRDEVWMIRDLRGDDAQAFADVMQEVRSVPLFTTCDLITPHPLWVYSFRTSTSVRQAMDLPDLSPRLRSQCLRSLWQVCACNALLPRSLQIPFCYNRLDDPLYSGGYADVWKGEYQGRPVAVKVPRLYSTSDFSKITSVGHLQNL